MPRFPDQLALIRQNTQGVTIFHAPLNVGPWWVSRILRPGIRDHFQPEANFSRGWGVVQYFKVIELSVLSFYPLCGLLLHKKFWQQCTGSVLASSVHRKKQLSKPNIRQQFIHLFMINTSQIGKTEDYRHTMNLHVLASSINSCPFACFRKQSAHKCTLLKSGDYSWCMILRVNGVASPALRFPLRVRGVSPPCSPRLQRALLHRLKMRKFLWFMPLEK